MRSVEEFWAGFGHDPRDPRTAHLRATDADRDQMHALLGEAFADGRLTREEYDERSTSVVDSRTLGEFPPLVADLLPAPPSVVGRRGALTPTQLEEQAVAAYQRELREAIAGFIVPSLICLVIWAVVMPGGFFWPAFVLLGTGVNLIQLRLRRVDVVAKHREKLEKKQLEQPGPDQPESQ